MQRKYIFVCQLSFGGFQIFKTKCIVSGVYYTMAIIGPALGYVVGGELLKIYTDFLTVDSST